MKHFIGRYVTAGVAAAFVTAACTRVVVAEQSTGLVPIIGMWSTINDGGPAFRIDTTGWSGKTERSVLESHARALFSTVNDTFITNGMSAEAFPLAVFRETENFTGGTIRVQFKLIDGGRDRSGGIVLNLKPNGEYLFVRYNTLDGDVAVWRYRNGARERIAHGPTNAQLPLNTWHELVVTVNGTKLTGSVNGGELKHELTLTEPVSGRVGLWAKRDVVTAFRNFRVTQ